MNTKTPKWKIITYLISLTTLGSGSVVAWEIGWLDQVWQWWTQDQSTLTIDPAPRSATPSDTVEWEAIQGYPDPPLTLPTERPPTDDYDTEEWHSQQPVEPEATGGYARTQSKRPRGSRVGCICMDNDRQDSKGAGACSGHGGVRFWLYKQGDGSILEHPTKRHRMHPSAFSSEELSNLSYHNQKGYSYFGNASSNAALYWLLALLIICLTLAYVVKLWWAPNTTNNQDEVPH